MQIVALSWLVWRMTKSPFLLGAVEGSHMLPVLALGLFGGWIADRFHRQKILIATQFVAMCQALALAVLTLTGAIQVWHCIVLALIMGTINAFEVPSRQAFLSELVSKDDLVNAISLNSSLFNGARIAGPALAGLLVPIVGEGVCFLVNAFSYIATLTAFWLIRTDKDREVVEARKSTVIAESFRFIIKRPHVVRVLCLGAVMSLCGMNYGVLMPIFASEILNGDIRTLAALRAGAGIGACAAAIILASRASGERLKKGIGYASMIFGAMLLSFAWSRTYWLSQILIVVAGFAMTTQLSGGHSLMQLAVSDRLRGRVLSVYMTVMMGLSPIGSFIIGWAAARWGAPPVVSVCASICVLAGALYTISRLLAPKERLEPAKG